MEELRTARECSSRFLVERSENAWMRTRADKSGLEMHYYLSPRQGPYTLPRN